MKSKIAILFLAVMLIGVRFWDPAAVEITRASLFDFYQRLSPRDMERLPVTVIDIDEQSLKEFGQWPWPRSLLADLMDKLMEHYPSAVGLDFVFPEYDRVSPHNLATVWRNDEKGSEQLIALMSSLPDHDSLFAKSLVDRPIVLGRMLQRRGETNVDDVALFAPYGIHFSADNAMAFIPKSSIVIPNIEELDSVSQGIGVLSLLPERDGIIRRIPTLHQVEGRVMPSLGVEMLRLALQADEITVFSDAAGIDRLEVGGITVPTSANGLTWVYFNKHDPRRYVSAKDVLNGNIEPASLAGHLVLVGTSASGLLDIRPTPMNEQIAGVEVWAQWLESVLFGEPLERPNYIFVAEILATALVCILMICLVSISTAAISIAVMGIISVLMISLSWWFFKSNMILLDFSFPLLSGAIIFVTLTLYNFWKEEQQRKVIYNAFSLYLTPVLVEELAAHPESLRLDGESRVLTSLFTDLEGFTTLSENLAPGELVDMLNEYLDGMCEVAMKHDGTIDKIIGDALHVIFGAPNRLENHAQSALECALAMDEFSQRFNEKVKQQNKQFGLTRIGVNTGEAVVGNFGGKNRFVYTAYGDTINAAARLEAANKPLGTRICISRSTADLCKEKTIRSVGFVSVKGKSKAIEVFEPLPDGAPELAYLKEYEDAFEAIKSGNEAANMLILALLEKYPNDPLVKLYHRRLFHELKLDVHLPLG